MFASAFSKLIKKNFNDTITLNDRQIEENEIESKISCEMFETDNVASLAKGGGNVLLFIEIRNRLHTRTNRCE